MYIGTLSLARDGNIYFGGRIKTEPYPGIFLSRPVDGEYGPIEAVEITGTAADQTDVHVDPDERFMLFSSYYENPSDGVDLYISRRQPDSSWGAPVSLGSAVNTVNFERFPYVSGDGQRLFFVRSMGSEYCAEDTMYYWISAEILDGVGN